MSLARFGVELRASLSGNTLTGHAAVFGVTAKMPGGWEQMDPSAFDKALASETTDVRALFNHDPSMVLGRQSAGNLRLDVDDQGLAFEVDLPDTTLGRDVRALVEGGLVSGASFGFIPGDDEWDRAPDGRQRRTHTRVADLIDVSVVTFPAYDGAGVRLRHHTFETVPHARSQLIRARYRATAQGGRT
jgi:HK97 family phage prohead protease